MKLIRVILLVLVVTHLNTGAEACSTFKLQHGDQLVYGHNLNEGDIGVPGMIFVNKRGVFKIGRTWTELATKDQLDASGYTWISRYGSVTFNSFGRDFPDGGMNEAGLYIWEMNDDPVYPQNDSLPTLNQMNWMQYILDQCSSTEEAIQCAFDIEIEGWGWHYFIGDATGKTAAVNFVNGQVVVHTGEEMPVPGLFNTPYERELEILKYYKGFGGMYPVGLNDPEVPRFVKVADMLKNYRPGENIVSDGFKMLDQIKVYDEPEWSVIMDVKNMAVHFKTRLNPEIKRFAFAELDFSHRSPLVILNIDIPTGGEVVSQFIPYSNIALDTFFKKSLFPIMPESMITAGGITLDEWAERFSSHTDKAMIQENQFFTGRWKDEEGKLTLTLESKNENVSGTISNGKQIYPLEHLSMKGHLLKATFKTHKNTFMELTAEIKENKINFTYRDATRTPPSKMTLFKKSH